MLETTEKAKMAEYQRAYRTRNKEKLAAWRVANREHIRARQKKWRVENYERVRASEKKSRAKHIIKHRIDTRERMRKLRRDHPERFAWHRRKRTLKRFGQPPEYKDNKFIEQGKKCGICRSVSPGCRDWHLDHCHATNKARGVLCAKCNLLLGHASDNTEVLAAAIEYLKQYSKPKE